MIQGRDVDLAKAKEVVFSNKELKLPLILIGEIRRGRIATRHYGRSHVGLLYIAADGSIALRDMDGKGAEISRVPASSICLDFLRNFLGGSVCTTVWMNSSGGGVTDPVTP